MLHQAVREGFPGVSASVSLPKRVHDEVRRYLQCGDLRRGFVVVKCEACAEATLVAFSCKGRGWCPSCGARRAHETALHLDAVLPAVAYRQWTLSLPGVLRWLVVKDTKLLRAVERCLVRSIFRWQRLRARRLGARGKKTSGAVSFTQLFGSALQLTPHLHVLVPEGVWSNGVFVELPPPTTEDAEAVLARTVRQLAPLFESREAPWPEDEFEALQARGTQLKLLLPEEPQPGRRGLLAMAMGLSLHADTWVHGNDRAGLLRLCRYGARGPVAESTRRRPVCVRDKARSDAGDDGGAARAQIAVADSTARPASDELPLRAGRALRAARAGGSEADDARTAAPAAAAGEEAAASENRPFDRLRATLLHRTFGCDVWKCPCGGQRRVVSLVTNRRTAEEMLRNMGLLQSWPPLKAAQGPPQRELFQEH